MAGKLTSRRRGMDLSIPVDKTWNRHDLYLSTLVVRPGDKSRSATPETRGGPAASAAGR
ncbi:hypothetical protein LNQ03_25830 [Klebsiella pneumoniae subsp. pneumoniae]|nr:hypothetical protein [Klebsiella pneumoniae subsp. pneumoniae]